MLPSSLKIKHTSNYRRNPKTFGEQSAMAIDNTLVRFDGTSGAVQGTNIVVDDLDNVTLPAKLDVSGDTSLRTFGSVEMGGTNIFGHLPTFETKAPVFQVEDNGRTKVRYRSGILYDPGDTAEHAFYVAAGDPDNPRPRGLTDGGTNETGQNTAWFSHMTMLATRDDAPSDNAEAVLSNPYRTIAPIRLDSGSPNFTATKYVVGVAGYTDGKAFCLRFGPGVSSGSNPRFNLNSWGFKDIKLSNGSTPANNLWGPLTEIIVEYHAASGTLRCRPNSDTSAGYTERGVFSNPNYARSLLMGARFRTQPTQTARPVNYYIASVRPEEIIPRDSLVTSDIGSVISMGLGSYEEAPSDAGWAPKYNYPGEMVSTGTDPMWTGNEFAGNWLHNAFTISGWGNFSAVASDQNDFAAY
jgi:hypothetical protein